MKHPGNEKNKWNYVFLESLKMAVVLPLVILAVEMFLLHTWPDMTESPERLLYDYLFLFSMIFLFFVVFHLFLWKRDSERT